MTPPCDKGHPLEEHCRELGVGEDWDGRRPATVLEPVVGYGRTRSTRAVGARHLGTENRPEDFASNDPSAFGRSKGSKVC
jgi:hypothetical protein